MGRATFNFLRTDSLDVRKDATFSYTTTTTSITVVTAMTSTLSSQVLFTTQKIYFSGGIINSLSTVTSTEVVLD